MKKVMLLSGIMLFAFTSIKASADSEMYLGPTIGATTTSSADGSLSRDMHGSYGADAFYILDHFALGASYRYFGIFSDGNNAININQVDNWLSAEAKYLFTFHDFHPYVTVGAGSVMQGITTTVVGSASDVTATYFARDIGLGLLGRFGSNSSVGFNVGARYFQYSNVNGFDYTVSIGFFPDFAK